VRPDPELPGARHWGVPRSNRRRKDEVQLDLDRALRGVERREQHRDGDWFVRRLTGASSSKTYRCPGCDQEITPGQPHVVVWRADGPWSDAGAVGSRRHWHTPCWQARARRGR
jgi:hypothetical protein